MARILVVEDEQTNREVAVIALRNAGHVVDHAANGMEALECLARSTFDLVLMDVLMPELDGIEATRAIRADQTQATIRIIGVTARVSEEDRRVMLEAGMDAVIGKPYHARDLRQIVDRFLT